MENVVPLQNPDHEQNAIKFPPLIHGSHLALIENEEREWRVSHGFAQEGTMDTPAGSAQSFALIAILPDSSSAYSRFLNVATCIYSPLAENALFSGKLRHEAASLIPDETGPSVRDTLFEIRRLIHFTWNEIASLIDVDRRTLHNWVKGSEIRTKNADKLGQILTVLRYADRGDHAKTRAVLRRTDSSGRSVEQFIKEGQYEAARILAGPGNRPVKRRVAVSKEVSLRYGPSGLFIPDDPIDEEVRPEAEAETKLSTRRRVVRRRVQE
jgi:DNA-binding transcriptional regulator YiaG